MNVEADGEETINIDLSTINTSKSTLEAEVEPAFGQELGISTFAVITGEIHGQIRIHYYS